MTTGFYQFGNDPAEVMNSTYLDVERRYDAGIYLHGICGVFAAALAKKFGYEICMLRDAEDEPGIDSALHIFCVCNNSEAHGQLFVDARGITDNRHDVIGEFGAFFEVPVIEWITLPELEIMLNRDLGSSYGSYLHYAVKLIQEHPDYYIVK